MDVQHSLPVLALCAFLGGCGAYERTSDTDPVAVRASVVTQERQQELTPQDVLAELKAGNKRFVRGESTQQNWLQQAKLTAENGQYPKAIVLSCLDSRVPTEIVFDQGIGDIFVGRVAGNFENTDMLGSMEFGTKLAGSKVIVVLGHTSCGAVKGAIADAKLGNLTETLANIKPAVEMAGKDMPGLSADDGEFVQAVVENNVRITVSDIADRSPVMGEMIASGDLLVVGAWYDLATGEIHWLD